MGLLKHFRSRSRLKDNNPQPTSSSSVPPLPYQSQPRYGRAGPDYTQRLPDKVLANIFSYVCPHSQDTSYETCEDSQIGDGCMLCDLRDLAKSAQTCRKWYATAQSMLYGSVRIDAVHYCELEEILADQRKKNKKHFRSKSNVEPVEVPNIRLSLLCRTVREQRNLAQPTLFLKLPFMTRETAKGELARTVAALPNLRYVDLPDGFFTGDSSCMALRQELQARCPDIRKMSYRSGSEGDIELLAQRHWQAIEMLDLTGLSIEPATLRIVLGSLPTLRELTLSDMPWIDDTIFQSAPGQLPDFPPLHILRLKHTPNVTAQGLNTWLHAPHVREVLYSLTLEAAGVTVQDLSSVLWSASSIRHLSIVETVSKSLGLAAQQVAPLASISLRTLHFEITSSDEVQGLQKPAESYYSYLASSLHQNALPALTTLYVRDQHFPELLILPPFAAPFGNGSDRGSLASKPSNLSSMSGNPRGPPGGGFNQTLEVFAKGIDELEWVFTAISPGMGGRDNRSSIVTGGRPLSAYSASRGLGPQWAQGGFGGEARKSVMVGNGFGGFLAVPQEEVPRPMTSDGAGGSRWSTIGSAITGVGDHSFLRPPPAIGGESKHERRGSRHDLWR